MSLINYNLSLIQPILLRVAARFKNTVKEEIIGIFILGETSRFKMQFQAVGRETKRRCEFLIG